MAPERLCPSAVAEVGVAAATLAGAAGVGRFLVGGDTGGALPPLLGTALVGFAVPALLRRTRLPPALGALAGTVATVVVATWFAALDAAGGRLPGAAALRALPGDLHSARRVLGGFHLPMAARPGVVLLAGVLCGLAGLAARLLLGPIEPLRPRLHPGLALLPGVALTGWSCLAVAGTGGAVVSAAVVAGSAVALAGGGRPPSRPAPSPASRHRYPAAGLVLAVAAVGAVAGVGLPIDAPTPPSGAAAVPVTALSLTTGLVAVERRDASLVLFRARSPVPTYWQVGVLTVWRGDRWVAGSGDPAPGARRAASATPAPTTASGRRITVSVTVGALSSRLLPVPPGTVSVTAPGATVTATGVLAPRPTTPGDTYRARAVALSVGSGGEATTGGLTAAELAPFLALPPVPAVVRALARLVTASATSALSRAEVLVDWFRSGRFRYTLTPPPPRPGTDPLVDFLTVSRAGTCESFAGAFAVMARTLGLPTRVAVGFTDGHPAADGATAVTGADAHAWPEVYLGAALGWVSFEPTPEQPSGALAPDDVVGPTALPVPVPSPAPAPTPTTSPPATSPVTVPAPTTTPTTPATTPAPSRSAAPVTGGGGGGWWWPAGLAGALVAGSAAVAVRRRRRLASPPPARIVAAYRRAERSLGRAGVVRPANRTPAAHAALVAGAAVRRAPGPSGDARFDAVVADLGRLSDLVELAGYGPVPPSGAEARAAEEAARRIRRALRRPGARQAARDLTLGAPAGRRPTPAAPLR